ncbi:MYND-type domain-containing protein [Mycena kentingensis (nom. inval.)]|nr:MYND-type domain-containing protein [Mycena kentingensis (nom. inval.)]
MSIPHPAFNLANLNRLSLRFKLGARRLLENPGGPGVESAFLLAATPKQSRELFPLFYALLDPLRIPAAAELVAPSPTLLRVIAITRDAITSLYKAPIVDDAPNMPDATLDPYRAIWERLWPWVQFLRDNLASLPAQDHSDSELDLLTRFIQFSGFVFGGIHQRQLVMEEPGFLFVVFRAWSLAMEDTTQHVIRSFAVFFPQPHQLNGVQLEEVISATGGSLDTLGRLFARFLTICATRILESDRHGDVQVLGALFGTLSAVDNALGRRTGIICVSNPGRFSELVAHLWNGPTLVAVLHALTLLATGPRGVGGGWQHAVAGVILQIALVGYASRRRLRTMLAHDLLADLAAISQHRLEETTSTHMFGLLRHVLCPCTLFRRTSVAISEALHQQTVTAALTTPALRRNERISESWNILVEMACVHARFFKRPAAARQAACDNLECGRIADWNNFRRCSGCDSRVYCSPACQTVDWRSGNHRSSCDFLRQHRASLLQTYSRSELHDIRFILDAHYKQTASVISMMQAHFDGKKGVTAPGTPSANFVAFDFHDWQLEQKIPYLEVDALAAPEERQYVAAEIPGWNAWVSRASAAQGAGKVILHVAEMKFGGRRTLLVFPLRSSSSYNVDESRALYRRVFPPGVVPGEAERLEFHRKWCQLDRPSARGFVELHGLS